jgi:hypothetical protein
MREIMKGVNQVFINRNVYHFNTSEIHEYSQLPKYSCNMDIHDFYPHVNYISAQWKHLLKYTEIDSSMICDVDDSSYNAP